MGMAACSANVGSTGSVLCAEAGAWREALEFALVLGMSMITLEGDSQQLVRILNNEMKCPAEIEVLVEDIRRYVQGFRVYKFRFVRRSTNMVADKLARVGLRDSGVKTWKPELPLGYWVR